MTLVLEEIERKLLTLVGRYGLDLDQVSIHVGRKSEENIELIIGKRKLFHDADSIARYADLCKNLETHLGENLAIDDYRVTQKIEDINKGLQKAIEAAPQLRAGYSLP